MSVIFFNEFKELKPTGILKKNLVVLPKIKQNPGNLVKGEDDESHYTIKNSLNLGNHQYSDNKFEE